MNRVCFDKNPVSLLPPGVDDAVAVFHEAMTGCPGICLLKSHQVQCRIVLKSEKHNSKENIQISDTF